MPVLFSRLTFFQWSHCCIKINSFEGPIMFDWEFAHGWISSNGWLSPGDLLACEELALIYHKSYPCG